MISAAFTVNSASNPAAHSVSYGSTVNLQLLSVSGATSIVWEMMACSDADESLPSITISGTPQGRLASFVMPADSSDGYGRTFLVRCTVSTELLGSSGGRQTVQEYAVIGAPNARGIIPIAPGEENYRHGTHGWAPEVNIALANTAGPGGGSGSGAGGVPQAKFVMTSNDALTGLGARDGYTPTDGGIGLFVGQTTKSQNGYWEMHSGAATRPAYFDSDADVALLVGAIVPIQSGTLGTGTNWYLSTGSTLAGSKTYLQALGNPDIVYGANGGIVELGSEEGTSLTRSRIGTRVRKEVSTTIASGGTATIWTWDGNALGFQSGDPEIFAPNVIAKWASDSKVLWCSRCLVSLNGTPPTIIGKRAQVGEEGSGGTLGWLVLDWSLSHSSENK